MTDSVRSAGATEAIAGAPAIQSYRLRVVESRQDLEEFIHVPFTVFRGDPNFSPPLLMDRRHLLTAKHNPYFEHAEARYWLATKNGEAVGRISGQVDELVQRHMEPGTGQFGMFDCVEDQGLADALLGEMEAWLKAEGMTRALGPFNLSINGEVGLLIDGFDMPPSVMMGHARPYYRRLIEQRDYEKVIDAYAYWLDITRDAPPAIEKLFQWGEANPRFRIRKVDKRNLYAEIRTVLDIFNDAWSDNWGFVPLTDPEIEKLAADLKPVLFPYLNRICEYDGEPIAFMITLPDVNRLTADLDGRLLPFGWLKLLWRLKRGNFSHFRVPLMGVKKKFQRSRVGAVAAITLIEKIRRETAERGGKYGELSWILENNEPMRNILTTNGSDIYKTYRIYERSL